ncbi:MAG: DNA translocase FtsK 4TM domain-containing protein [Patescibacteria group bacterium]
MGRKRKHPKHKQKKPKWYQRENDWGDYVFDWSLGLSGEAWREIFAFLIVIAASVVLLGFFDSAGVVGERAVAVTRGLFGPIGAYIFTLIFLYAGIIMVIPQKRYRLSKFIGLFLFVAAITTFIHLFIPVEESAGAAAESRGGGYLGYLVSTPLRQAIGLFPTFLFSISLLVISFLLTFNFSISQYLGWDKKKSEEEEGAETRSQVHASTRVSVFEAVRRRITAIRQAHGSRAKAPVLEVENPLERRLPAGRQNLAWEYPPIEMLKDSDEVASSGNIQKNAETIGKTLKNFNIETTMGDVNIGPTVTQYTLKPSEGVKLNQIVARQNDLALALSAKSIRVEAPIPGKNAVGIEIPNKVAAKVTLREVLISKEFKNIKSKLALSLGRDVAGEPVAIDLDRMPHLLIAGATGSGKSVCINSIIITLLYNNAPDDLRLLLVDPKRVELTGYNGIPHLLAPVVTEVDKTVSTLKWAVHEMERRYDLFSRLGRRNIAAYNTAPAPEEGPLPYIVIVIDELADLMASSAKEVEGSIVRLAQMARAIGIHLIVATQRPSVDVITGLIKANIPCRVAFATASQVDSRTILDVTGAEKLLGNGDMLFMGNGVEKPRRVQGCYVSDNEIEEVNSFLRSKGEAQYDESILTFRTGSKSVGAFGGDGSAEDGLYDEAIETVLNAGKASASLLQRRLRIGYARAARLLDILEEAGVIGPAEGAKPRDVLIAGTGRETFQPHGEGAALNNSDYGRDNSEYM